VSSQSEHILSCEIKKGNLWTPLRVRLAALRLLNTVDLNAVQTSGGGRVEPRAGINFGVYGWPNLDKRFHQAGLRV